MPSRIRLTRNLFGAYRSACGHFEFKRSDAGWTLAALDRPWARELLAAQSLPEQFPTLREAADALSVTLDARRRSLPASGEAVAVRRVSCGEYVTRPGVPYAKFVRAEASCADGWWIWTAPEQMPPELAEVTYSTLRAARQAFGGWLHAADVS